AEAWGEYFSDKGFTPRCEADPAHGLALLEREPVPVAVVDYHMPGMDGLALVREVRRRGLPVQVILVSSDDDPGLARRAQAEGLMLLSKAAAPRVLLQTVEQALKSLEPTRSHARCRLLLTGAAEGG